MTDPTATTGVDAVLAGNRIMASRVAAGLSQDALARAARVSRPTIAAAERGDPIRLHTAVAIARVLGTTLDDLYPMAARA